MLENQKFLIVLDCDGTLLTDEKKVLPKTKSYLMELAKRGNIITMASGRPDRAILPYYRELECHGPFIGYNGSIILDPDDKNFPVFKKKYPVEIIKDFLSHFKIDDFNNIMAEDEKNLFFLYEEHEYENYFHPQGMKVHYGPILDAFKEDLFGFIISLKNSDLLTKVEDELANARRYYNGVVNAFNTKIELFPTSLLAGFAGCHNQPLFSVDDESERKAVKVEF